MKINISSREFLEKWYLKNDDSEIYTNGSLSGIIIYEDQEYMVIELRD